MVVRSIKIEFGKYDFSVKVDRVVMKVGNESFILFDTGVKTPIVPADMPFSIFLVHHVYGSGLRAFRLVLCLTSYGQVMEKIN